MARVGDIFMIVGLSSYIEEPGFYARIPTMRSMAKTLLRTHRRLHREGILKLSNCISCAYIQKNEKSFLQFAPDMKLYPPYKFTEK